MNFKRNLNYFFILPGVLAVAAAFALGTWGLKAGIDLAGGSLLEVHFAADRPAIEQVREQVDVWSASWRIGEVRVQPTGEDGYILRQRDLSNEEHQTLFAILTKLGQAEEVQFTSIGPSIGEELLTKGWIAIGLVALLTIFFIAFVFRHSSKPSSWKYGVVAIVTLTHDILLPAGLFAFLGFWIGAEVDALFIVALLTILGVSINDTIVVFDRIRENLKINEEKRKREEFDEVVGKSISQTIARSFNTSVTIVIVLLALYFLGPESTRNFALTLTVGMIAGTYSSIFLASPLLVVWEKWSRKKS